MNIPIKQSTYHKRFEDKYLLLPDTTELFFDQLQGKISEKENAIVENIYFDCPKLSSYEDSVNKRENRLKLRLRQYERQFETGDAFFEIKERAGDIVNKKRLLVKKAWAFDFVNSGDLPIRKLLELNSHIKQADALETLEKLSDLIQLKAFRPVLKTRYKRTSYALNGDRAVRITLDQNLKFRSEHKEEHFLAPVSSSYKQTVEKNREILEIKYLRSEDLFSLEDQIKALGSPQVFSKYCTGIYSTFGDNDPVIGLDSLSTARLEGQYLDNILASI